jgi:ATP-dependent exoDNAse (exonuclease V) beta subunit
MTTGPETLPLVDDEARRRIGSDDLAETLFVEAGAGSAKTTVLVDRVVNLVLQRGVRLSSIAAITFTEAAAAELRDRIRERFERRSKDDAVHRQACLDAVADADRAAITTLHGFALRILNEHPMAAGLPPRVQILDEVSSQLAQEQRWVQFVDGLHADAAHEPLLLRAHLTGVMLEQRYPNQITLAQVTARLAQSWDRLELIAVEEHGALAPIDFGAFDAAVDALAAARDDCIDDGDRLWVHLGQVLEDMRAVSAIEDPLIRLERLRGVEWKKSTYGATAAWGCDPKTIRALVDAVNEAAKQVIRTEADQVLRRLLPMVAKEILRAAEDRRLEGRLEFHDLLVLAGRVLRSSESSRTALHERYSCLLLDEFQDTDPLQIELATMIAGSIDGQPPASWADIEVTPGRLFFVGDPKQSIYRFRRADIELFLRASRRFSPDTGPIRLTTNFRTVEPILTWINGLFETLMVEQPNRQPRYEPLAAGRTQEPGVDHRPVIFGGPRTGVLAPALREAEAADVAAVISDIRDDPDRWRVLDVRTGQWRDAVLSDVTVLIPTRTSLPYLRTALDGCDVPYRLDTGSLVFATQEISDVLAAVRAIDDPADEIALVKALRSPLYACSDVDLFTYHDAGGRWALDRPVPDELRDGPVGVALDHLRSLWEQRWWMGPATLVDRLVRERQAFLAAFGADRSREVWRRLRFLIDQARAFEDAGQHGHRAFLEWAELQRADGARVHEPLLPETDDVGVRVMTVHGAKGLEFPITIVSGMTTKPAVTRSGVRVVWEGGRPEVKLGTNLRTEGYDARADIEDEMDVEEKLRLLYVATTRARDHLVVSGYHKLSKAGVGDESYGHQLWRHSQACPQRWRPFQPSGSSDATEASEGTGVRARPADAAPVIDVGSVDSAPGPTASQDVPRAEQERSAWIAERDSLRAAGVRRRVFSATGVAGLADRPAPGSGSSDSDHGSGANADDAGDDDRDVELVAEDPDVVMDVWIDSSGDDDGRSTPAWRRGRAGTAIGRAVHAALQALDLSIDPSDPLVDRVAAREAELEVVPELADQVAAMVRSALASDAVALARCCPHYKELFVAAPVQDRAVEGYIDLLVDGDDGLMVVDYKTDTVPSEADVDAKLDYYEVQGAVYATAVEAATGRPVVECRFVFCRQSGAIERTVGDLEAAKRRVTDRLRHA